MQACLQNLDVTVPWAASPSRGSAAPRRAPGRSPSGLLVQFSPLTSSPHKSGMTGGLCLRMSAGWKWKSRKCFQAGKAPWIFKARLPSCARPRRCSWPTYLTGSQDWAGVLQACWSNLGPPNGDTGRPAWQKITNKKQTNKKNDLSFSSPF